MRALALAALLFAGAAHAGADEWQGWYGGIAAGPAYARSNWYTDAALQPDFEQVRHNMWGGMAGAQFGYNAVGGPFFVGGELGLYAADLEQRKESASVPGNEQVTNIRNPFYATVRMGFAGSRTLVYVRGGYAHADVELQATAAGSLAVWEGHANGWTAGTGFEVRVGPHWSVGLSYDYSRLRATNQDTSNSVGVAVHADDFTARVHAVLLRANYRF